MEQNPAEAVRNNVSAPKSCRRGDCRRRAKLYFHFHRQSDQSDFGDGRHQADRRNDLPGGQRRRKNQIRVGEIRQCFGKPRQRDSDFSRTDPPGRAGGSDSSGNETLFHAHFGSVFAGDAGGGAWERGGEVFVLDMGKPVKIVDLAKEMFSLKGEPT